MTLLHAIGAVFRLVFWRACCTRLFGGGPAHESYTHARWQWWLAREELARFVRGER